MHRMDPSTRSHSISWIIFSRLIGLLIYLVIIFFLLSQPVTNEIYLSIIGFLTTPSIIAVVVAFTILFLIGEVFFALGFPLNLPGPFFNALGSIFLVSFLVQVLYRVNEITDITVFSFLRVLEPLLYFLIFLIVLIVQYVHLFSREWEGERKKPEQAPTASTETKKEESPLPEKHGDVTWEEVGAEFRKLVYDFFHTLREALREK